MKSAFRALALTSVAAMALTSALALAQENAPGAAIPPDATTPDAATPDATTPDATTPDATTPDASAGNAPATAAPAQKSDWPCEQTERPEISVGQVWQGPDPSSAEETWRDNQAVVALVDQIAPRRMPQDEAVAAVHRFSAGFKDDRAAV